MQAQPYLLISDTVLASVARQLRGAIDAWCADWGVAADDIDFHCQRAWEAQPVPDGAAWGAPRGSGTELWWCARQAPWNRQLRDALFPPAAGLNAALTPHGLADEAAAAASDALCAALSGGAQAGPVVAPPALAWRRGSGALLVRLGIGGQALYLMASQGAVSAVARRTGAVGGRLAPLAPVDYRHALRDTGLTLALEIGRAEVGLGSLMGLGVGDVIRLDTLADRPLTVRGPGGAALFDGYLGLSGQHVALEIVRRD